jgi:hypothetical protein
MGIATFIAAQFLDFKTTEPIKNTFVMLDYEGDGKLDAAKLAAGYE